MAYTMAMRRDVAKTIGSENIRKGPMRATDRVLVKLCLSGTGAVGLTTFPTQILAARARRAYSTGPYVSICLSEVLQTRPVDLHLPGRNSRGTKDTPANIRATQYFRLQSSGETKPAIIGPLAGPTLRT